MEETKYCTNKSRTRECGIVHLSESHNLPIFDNIEVDNSVVFLSTDKTTKSFLDLKREILAPPQHLMSGMGVLYLEAKDVGPFQQLVNTTSQEFLQGLGAMRAYQRSGTCCLFSLRVLKTGEAVLFICNHSRPPLKKSTLLDPLSTLPGFLKTQGLPTRNYAYFSSSHSSFTDMFALAAALSSHELQSVPDKLKEDQVARVLAQNIQKEKELLSRAIQTSTRPEALQGESTLGKNLFKL